MKLAEQELVQARKDREELANAPLPVRSQFLPRGHRQKLYEADKKIAELEERALDIGAENEEYWEGLQSAGVKLSPAGLKALARLKKGDDPRSKERIRADRLQARIDRAQSHADATKHKRSATRSSRAARARKSK